MGTDCAVKREEHKYEGLKYCLILSFFFTGISCGVQTNQTSCTSWKRWAVANEAWRHLCGKKVVAVSGILDSSARPTTHSHTPYRQFLIHCGVMRSTCCVKVECHGSTLCRSLHFLILFCMFLYICILFFYILLLRVAKPLEAERMVFIFLADSSFFISRGFTHLHARQIKLPATQAKFYQEPLTIHLGSWLESILSITDQLGKNFGLGDG